MLATEEDLRSRHRRTTGSGLQRSKPVTAERRKPGASAGIHIGAQSWRDAGPSAKVEVQLVSDDQAHTARRMDVAKIPRTALARGSNEWSAIGAQPIHAVAAVAKGDVGDLGASISLADLVGRPAMYEEAPEHDALIKRPRSCDRAASGNPCGSGKSSESASIAGPRMSPSVHEALSRRSGCSRRTRTLT